MTDLIETLLFTADVHSDEKEGEDSSISLMCIRAVGEIRRLASELEHERKRLDWAILNGAIHTGYVLYVGFDGSEDNYMSTDPRATIDELMVKS